MHLVADLEQILTTVLPLDPSFRRVDKDAIENCVNAARREALANSKEGFLLSTMRLLALAGNGHTRLIPNDAISVLPLRFVTIGGAVRITQTASENTGISGGELVEVNGVPIAQIISATESYLAGTRQRRRVIGPILLAWPFALARFGFSSKCNKTSYRILDANGQLSDCLLDNEDTVPASDFYPRNEHGRANPDWAPDKIVEVKDWGKFGISISLPSFSDPCESALPKAFADVAERVRSHPNRPILIDLRGNTGGDFLQTMPLIDAISESAQKCRVAVLVDKFTFSAAIVFLAILKYRLTSRLEIIGEEMGDGLTFFAEGGLLNLPNSGAVVRYSSAFHDWETGSTDQTTPSEIAQQIVPAGILSINQHWTACPDVAESQSSQYRRFLKSLS